MNGLIKINYDSLPKEVGYEVKNIYEAHSSVLIVDIADKNIVVKSIHQSINRCIADKGITMDIEDINYLKRSVTDDIIKQFATLTLEDINLCFKMGVRGDLGEYFGINTVSFYQWLKKYKSELLPKTFQEVKKFIPQTKQEEDIDKKSLDLEKIENICNVILKYQKDATYDFMDYGNIHFNFLEKHGYFEGYREVELQSLKEDAKNEYIRQAKETNNNLISRGRSIQKVDIDKVIKNIEGGNKDAETSINLIYKKILMKVFIVDFENNNDLKEFKKELTKKVNKDYGK